MTSLVIDRRLAGLEHLDAPEGWSDLLIEWSAPRSCALDDPVAWRMASPFWHARRETHIRKALERALAGKSVDADEPDPLEAFRSQWLNEAPLSSEGPQRVVCRCCLMVRGRRGMGWWCRWGRGGWRWRIIRGRVRRWRSRRWM